IWITQSRARGKGAPTSLKIARSSANEEPVRRRIRDFEIYGVLRALAGAGLPLVVCWMLTADDGPATEGGSPTCGSQGATERSIRRFRGLMLNRGRLRSESRPLALLCRLWRKGGAQGGLNLRREGESG